MKLLALLFVVTAMMVADSFAATGKPCPEIACIVNRCSEYRVGADGCRTCRCVNPCEEIISPCASNQICIPKNVTCVKAPCYPVAKCIECPLPKCSNHCNSGFRKDSRGCQTCKCVDPCENKVCRAGLVCKSEKVICKKEPCYAVARCVKKVCQPVFCPRLCTSGYRKDINGCQTCSCIDPCEDRNPCPSGQVCKPEQVFCIAAPCYDVAKCVVDCSKNAICDMFCEFGFELGPDGCPICKCREENPCALIDCIPGRICQVINNTAQCIPAQKNCSGAMCKMLCPFGFKLGADGCEICECRKDCNGVACKDSEMCKEVDGTRRCVPGLDDPALCPSLKCKPCLSGYVTNQNGCQTCDCIDKCERVICPPKKVCQVNDIVCVRAPCPNQPRCVSLSY
ncbi:hypothetical protein HELRODRAFT_117034 [Helobdella robusta]|uniref:Antistasin-like domain-containing protein n=1 Tax=Helobdella robusta TaxID=6412 RepID=T1EGJ5_HELRO|nr:hypothetical protein HELRODRAFT_117034 [Helobdella robusta]ESO10309.1 hypothetical protein HELRODRAFT_117034 [Helobdella robusta]